MTNLKRPWTPENEMDGDFGWHIPSRCATHALVVTPTSWGGRKKKKNHKYCLLASNAALQRRMAATTPVWKSCTFGNRLTRARMKKDSRWERERAYSNVYRPDHSRCRSCRCSCSWRGWQGLDWPGSPSLLRGTARRSGALWNDTMGPPCTTAHNGVYISQCTVYSVHTRTGL